MKNLLVGRYVLFQFKVWHLINMFETGMCFYIFSVLLSLNNVFDIVLVCRCCSYHNQLHEGQIKNIKLVADVALIDGWMPSAAQQEPTSRGIPCYVILYSKHPRLNFALIDAAFIFLRGKDVMMCYLKWLNLLNKSKIKFCKIVKYYP